MCLCHIHVHLSSVLCVFRQYINIWATRTVRVNRVRCERPTALTTCTTSATDDRYTLTSTYIQTCPIVLVQAQVVPATLPSIAGHPEHVRTRCEERQAELRLLHTARRHLKPISDIGLERVVSHREDLK